MRFEECRAEYSSVESKACWQGNWFGKVTERVAAEDDFRPLLQTWHGSLAESSDPSSEHVARLYPLHALGYFCKLGRPAKPVRTVVPVKADATTWLTRQSENEESQRAIESG